MHMRGGIALVKAGTVSALLRTESGPNSSLVPQLLSVSPLAAWRGQGTRLALDVRVSGVDGSAGSILCGIGGLLQLSQSTRAAPWLPSR